MNFCITDYHYSIHGNSIYAILKKEEYFTLIQPAKMFKLNKKRHHKAEQAAAAHRANIQRNLAHRLEVARANGDEALIRQLEQEASYLDLR